MILTNSAGDSTWARRAVSLKPICRPILFRSCRLAASLGPWPHLPGQTDGDGVTPSSVRPCLPLSASSYSSLPMAISLSSTLDGKRLFLYREPRHRLIATSFVAGLGVGAASMLTPLYISENAPRAIRGGLTGIYQLFNVFGSMLAFWINYGSLLHLHGRATWIVPLAMQGIPAVLLFVTMSLCNESPRFLAKQDCWEQAKATLVRLRQLPESHPYIETEFAEMVQQIERERLLIGGASFWNLQKEMWTIPGNRKRAIISITLMMCQQMTGRPRVEVLGRTLTDCYRHECDQLLRTSNFREPWHNGQYHGPFRNGHLRCCQGRYV